MNVLSPRPSRKKTRTCELRVPLACMYAACATPRRTFKSPTFFRVTVVMKPLLCFMSLQHESSLLFTDDGDRHVSVPACLPPVQLARSRSPLSANILSPSAPFLSLSVLGPCPSASACVPLNVSDVLYPTLPMATTSFKDDEYQDFHYDPACRVSVMRDNVGGQRAIILEPAAVR